MKIRGLGVSLTCVLAAFTVSACGGAKRASAPATQPILTNAVIRKASPALGVSEDLAKACKIQMNDLGSAPKYEFDKSELQASDRTTLTKIAECLTTGPLKGRSIRLVGRADSVGESNYNMALGAHRAGGVADYLGHLGLASQQMNVSSRGELDAVGIDEAGRQTDRRVDIVLVTSP
jgi:peptidoglycan-associated lipoprotein